MAEGSPEITGMKLQRTAKDGVITERMPLVRSSDIMPQPPIQSVPPVEQQVSTQTALSQGTHEEPRSAPHEIIQGLQQGHLGEAVRENADKRLEELRQSIRDVLNGVPGRQADLVGFLTFGGAVDELKALGVPPTRIAEAVKARTEMLSKNQVPPTAPNIVRRNTAPETK